MLSRSRTSRPWRSRWQPIRSFKRRTRASSSAFVGALRRLKRRRSSVVTIHRRAAACGLFDFHDGVKAWMQSDRLQAAFRLGRRIQTRTTMPQTRRRPDVHGLQTTVSDWPEVAYASFPVFTLTPNIPEYPQSTSRAIFFCQIERPRVALFRGERRCPVRERCH